MDRQPAPYEAPYETETLRAKPRVVDTVFVRSPNGIYKLLQILISCIVLICVASSSSWYNFHSGGWVNFVAAISLITSSIFFIFYLFMLIRNLPGPWVVIEFAVLVICAFFWFLTIIIASCNTHHGAGAVAAAVFSAIIFVVFVVELITRFRVQRVGTSLVITMSGVRIVSNSQPPSSPKAGMPQINDPHIGFTSAYPAGDGAEEGYVMP